MSDPSCTTDEPMRRCEPRCCLGEGHPGRCEPYEEAFRPAAPESEPRPEPGEACGEFRPSGIPAVCTCGRSLVRHDAAAPREPVGEEPRIPVCEHGKSYHAVCMACMAEDEPAVADSEDAGERCKHGGTPHYCTLCGTERATPAPQGEREPDAWIQASDLAAWRKRKTTLVHMAETEHFEGQKMVPVYIGHTAPSSDSPAPKEELREALRDIASVDREFVKANGGWEGAVQRIIARAEEGLNA